VALSLITSYKSKSLGSDPPVLKLGHLNDNRSPLFYKFSVSLLEITVHSVSIYLHQGFQSSTI
jgi:hypothetical protein